MLGIVLDRSLPRSLGSQLCDQLRSLIVSGRIPGGSRLPSSRELSAELGLSRTLVLEAFEQLEAEGYVEGRPGSGSFACSGAALPRASAPAGRKGAPAPKNQPRGRSPFVIDFKPGVPALDHFPREAWARELAKAARRLPESAIGYGDGAGILELREEAASYLFRSRGLRAQAEDIFITSGISQALGIVSRAFLRPLRAAGGRGVACARARRAILENPCQPALSSLLEREGVEIFPARAGAEGIDPAALPADRPALAFVTPSHQYPLGSILSAPRRAALVEWARSSGSILFEDDFDGEYRYGGSPLQPLRELDPSLVIYAGSFSKAFSPALRLGYAVVPPSLRASWSACRELADIHSCVFTQAAMASFLGSGAYDRHVRRMKKLYARRRTAMLGALAAAFGDEAKIMGEAAGLHVAVRFGGPSFRGLRFDEKAVSRIASAGALVYPASRFAFAPFPGIERVLLLGYGNLDEEAIGKGVGVLASCLRG